MFRKIQKKELRIEQIKLYLSTFVAPKAHVLGSLSHPCGWNGFIKNSFHSCGLSRFDFGILGSALQCSSPKSTAKIFFFQNIFWIFGWFNFFCKNYNFSILPTAIRKISKRNTINFQPEKCEKFWMSSHFEIVQKITHEMKTVPKSSCDSLWTSQG